MSRYLCIVFAAFCSFYGLFVLAGCSGQPPQRLPKLEAPLLTQYVPTAEQLAFWRFIEQVDGNALYESTTDADHVFSQRTSAEQKAIAQGFDQLMNIANNRWFYAMQSLLDGRGGGDDQFEYFRRALIVQGMETFARLHERPDDWGAVVGAHGWDAGALWLESLGELEMVELTMPDTPLFGESFVWNKAELQQNFPNSWQLLGARYQVE